MSGHVLSIHEDYAIALANIAKTCSELISVEHLSYDVGAKKHGALEIFSAAYKNNRLLLKWDLWRTRRAAKKACQAFNATSLICSMPQINNIDGFLELVLSRPNSEDIIRSAIKCCLTTKRFISIKRIEQDILDS